jgi:hypothetical protein
LQGWALLNPTQEVSMKRQFMFGTMLAAAFAVGVGAQSGQTGSPGQAGQSGAANQDRSGRTVTVTGCLQSGDRAGSTSQSPTGDTTSRQQAGQTGSQSQYVLTNASMASGATGTGATGTGTGTSGTGATTGAGTGTGAGSTAGSATAGSTQGSAGAMTSFRLQGGDSSDLQKYVNSRVEVTGTLQSATDRGSATGSGATGSPTGSTAGSATGTGTGSTGSATGTGAATGSTASGATAGASASDRNVQTLRVTSVRQVAGSCAGGEGR